MKLQFHNKYKKIFLTPDSKLREKSKVDIVLSPELYWCRVFEIPVNKSKKANRALPILFEELIPAGNYEYACFKLSENTFISFAVCSTKIIKTILDSGLNLNQVHNIYLAQEQMKRNYAFKINNNYYQYFNEILVKLPYKLNQEYEELTSEIKGISSNKYKINLQLYSEFVNKKYLETIYILLFMICFLSVFKYVQFDRQVKENEQYIQQVKIKYSLPESNLKFMSIKNNLKYRYDLNKKFKFLVNYLISYKNELTNGVIQNMQVSKKKILITYSNVEEEKLEKYLKKRIEKFTIKTKNQYLQIEVNL